MHLMLEMGPAHLKSQQQTLPMERTFSWALGTRQSPRHFVNKHRKDHLCRGSDNHFSPQPPHVEVQKAGSGDTAAPYHSGTLASHLHRAVVGLSL